MHGNNVLILFAHPAQEQSEVNVRLFDTARHISGVTCVDLYAEYPDHDINVSKEQQRLRDHDVIVFQFPLYWYSTPAILKDWMDLVLQHGFAYGKDGHALKDKTLFLSLTAGGPEKAYQTEGFNHFSVRELLRPLEQTALFCSMNFAPPMVLFAARAAIDEGHFSGHQQQWRDILTAMVSRELDFKRCAEYELMSDYINQHPVGSKGASV